MCFVFFSIRQPIVQHVCLVCVCLMWALQRTRFCTCRVLSYGSTFYDLVVHCSTYIRSKMKVAYQEPPDGTYARAIMDMSMESRIQKLKDLLDAEGTLGDQERSSLLARRFELFLCIFNGDWKDFERPWHYCNMNCPCGGRRHSELIELAVTLYIEVILGSRPTVPALSRWLKCSKTSRWFLWQS